MNPQHWEGNIEPDKLCIVSVSFFKYFRAAHHMHRFLFLTYNDSSTTQTDLFVCLFYFDQFNVPYKCKKQSGCKSILFSKYVCFSNHTLGHSYCCQNNDKHLFSHYKTYSENFIFEFRLPLTEMWDTRTVSRHAVPRMSVPRPKELCGKILPWLCHTSTGCSRSRFTPCI